MESFTLTMLVGWQTLASILSADPTFSGKYLWSSFNVNNVGAGAIVVKTLPGSTAPAGTSGANLGAGDTQMFNAPIGAPIDGRAIWINSIAGGDIDITIHRYGGT